MAAVLAGALAVGGGVTATYDIDSSTTVAGGSQLGAIQTGHTVSVTATVSGTTATATTLVDQTLTQQSQPSGSPSGAPIQSSTGATT